MEYRSCPYNFETCAKALCENWNKIYGCDLLHGITSFDSLEKRLCDLNDAENLIMKVIDGD